MAKDEHITERRATNPTYAMGLEWLVDCIQKHKASNA